MPQHLGQHFLKNTVAVGKIITALDLQPGETVIEIGPGKGALTVPLLEQCGEIGCNYIGVEKDIKLISDLEILTSRGKKSAEIVHGDILRKLPDIVSAGKTQVKNYKLVGNIPYYITGALLRVISELENKPTLTILMLQREVAERLSSTAPQMNLLAAATQVWAEPKLLFSLKPSDFDPAPAVHSSVAQLKTKKVELNADELKKYYSTLHQIFKQPRKTLFNNLRGGGVDPATARSVMERLSLPDKARPQDLTVEQCLEIARTTL